MIKKLITIIILLIFSLSLFNAIEGVYLSCDNILESNVTSVLNSNTNQNSEINNSGFNFNNTNVVSNVNNNNVYTLSKEVRTQKNAEQINKLLLNSEKPNIFKRIKNFFVGLLGLNKDKSTTTVDSEPSRNVFLGGNAIGFSIEGDGVVVVGISEVDTPLGRDIPTKFSNLKEGDIIKKIENIDITSGEKIGEIINSEEFVNKTLNLELMRDGKTLHTSIKPALDSLTQKYKLGLWIRDNSSGVGTLTYIEKSGEFAALGHPVSDIDTGTIIPLKNGQIFKSTIIGVKKGVRGVPGELKGMFVKGANLIGQINSNNQHGIFGKFEQNHVQNYSIREIELAKRSEVTPGKAIIFTCIDGSKVEEFEIEIIKTNNQLSPTEKNMVIRVIDKRLLESTGGIVQGMSGSPIVQNNKLVGCVTHVFINDPTKGFAIFIDIMNP